MKIITLLMFATEKGINIINVNTEQFHIGFVLMLTPLT